MQGVGGEDHAEAEAPGPATSVGGRAELGAPPPAKLRTSKPGVLSHIGMIDDNNHRAKRSIRRICLPTAKMVPYMHTFLCDACHVVQV
jgi:hypothetical protein